MDCWVLELLEVTRGLWLGAWRVGMPRALTGGGAGTYCIAGIVGWLRKLSCGDWNTIRSRPKRAQAGRGSCGRGEGG